VLLREAGDQAAAVARQHVQRARDGYAKKKAKLVDRARHVVLEGTHPSPLSANTGFFGSKPFSEINRLLREGGKPEIDWQLPLG